jgi:ATP-dependent helicase/nuclease subunit A
VRAALRAAKCATASADLLILSEAILARYGALKAAQGALDFDDMILKTLALLEKAPGWVQYKLDQGIDHILVDEAQDTNPEQWRILAALAGEFFAGAGARAAHRTVFAVGDVKQSIYGFQRAAPEAFAQMRASLAARAADAGGAWEDVALDLSFRSAPAILRSVDAVCAGLDMGTDAPAHRAHRADAGGVVEVWPLLEPDAGAATEEGEEAEGDLWDPPLRALEARSGAEKMAARVAEKVCQWLQSKEIVPSTGAPTRPGDILVLLRKRGALAPLVTRALKRAGVPVGGADRLVLTEHLAVQDLIAAARFALLPGDDLSLACLLRSPLIGWGEGALFRVAHGRTGALWEALPQDAYLQGLVDAAPGASPFVFFSGILEAPCPADPGGSGWRALAARLGADAREPLEAFLAQALAFGAGPLEAFLAGLEAGQGGEVKRETEGAAGHVRVMTVHGAKGLQAPIVVLPDTVVTQKAGVAKAESRLMWTEAGLPLWSPGPDTECAAFDALRLRQAETQAREEARAAYVAMTRAQDRLYIGGYTGKRAPQEDSWYFAMRRGVKGLAGTKALPDGTLRLADVGTAEPQAAQGHRAQLPESYGLPPWARAPAPAEALGGPPLYPSRLAEDEDEEEVAAPSPLLAAGRGAARTRGDVTHALFQLLPALDPAARATAAAAYARAHGAGADVAQEVLGVIQDPRFADVFGPGSLAEVAVAGTLPDGRALSGRIDRLLVEPGRVTIVDFKTGRPPGDSGPAPLYKRQMAAYAALVSQLYPGRAVRCVLLYTQGPEWVEL